MRGGFGGETPWSIDSALSGSDGRQVSQCPLTGQNPARRGFVRKTPCQKARLATGRGCKTLILNNLSINQVEIAGRAGIRAVCAACQSNKMN